MTWFSSLGLRAKLFVLSLGLIVISLVSGDLLLRRSLEEQARQSIADDLLVRLSLVADAASLSVARDGDVEAFDALADQLGKSASARVTLIAIDGRVLGDSDLTVEQVRHIEGHADRPEVIAALSAGRGMSTRYSTTMGERMTYASMPFTTASSVNGIARVALSLASVDRVAASARQAILLGGVLAVGVAALLSSLAAQLAAKPVRALIDAAQRMASGEISLRTRTADGGELATLGRALDGLAQSLERSIGDLRSERDRLRGILGGMEEGILLLDDAGRIELVNPALRELLHLTGEVEGKTLLEAARRAELREVVARAHDGDVPSSAEIEVPGPPRPRRLLVRAAPRPNGMLVVFVDVTQLRLLETARRDFVDNASHELRTPIAAILSAAETLQDGALSHPVAGPKFVDMIARNAERLKALADDLLDLSKAEAQRGKMVLEAGQVGPIVEHVASLFRERAEKRRIALSTNLPALHDARFEKGALETALSNLLDNAVKYCPEGAAIRVTGTESKERVRLSVADTGTGIERRHLARLFERFYRVDPGRARDVGGTGLGLAIVKHLVESMGGSVEVESTPGRGSTFHVDLPLAAATEDSPALPRPKLLSRDSSTRTLPHHGPPRRRSFSPPPRRQVLRPHREARDVASRGGQSARCVSHGWPPRGRHREASARARARRRCRAP